MYIYYIRHMLITYWNGLLSSFKSLMYPLISLVPQMLWPPLPSLRIAPLFNSSVLFQPCSNLSCKLSRKPETLVNRNIWPIRQTICQRRWRLLSFLSQCWGYVPLPVLWPPLYALSCATSKGYKIAWLTNELGLPSDKQQISTKYSWIIYVYPESRKM